MRTGIDARSFAVLAAIAAVAVSLAACGTRAPSLTFTPIPHSTPASPAASDSAGASAAASSASPSAAASGSAAAAFKDARHAAIAFTGTYKAQLLIISATGAVAQNIGMSQNYVWHVTTACGGLCAHATSSSNATFTLKYANDEFTGTGGGATPCKDAAGHPVAGKSFRTSLSITLKPDASRTPIPSLTGEELLTVAGACTSASSSGSEVIQYKLIRAGR